MTPDWAHAIVLSTTEFEVTWEMLDLGETPWQLDPPRSGRTWEARRAIVQGALHAMQQRGLGNGSHPRGDVAQLMATLAYPEWAADIRYLADTLVAGVASCRAGRCALAVRRAKEIALLWVPPEDFGRSLIGLLGPIVPGQGRDVRLPAGVLDAAASAGTVESDAFADELVRLGTDRADVRALVGSCRGAGLRGQLGASARLGDGTRVRRASGVVGFHRTPAGHFRQLRRPTDAGDVVTIGPTNEARMVSDLDELLAGIR
ncbi:ESX secretion-associated protein EspG [Pseudonocardia sp. TRM90224]|uniref:ESX secretion-associated protein EspG n=1 Tax=Pseudonocardia sp. TRM90224 TaxID=2812678 RepID=UPI001E2F3781|nr:ESX secretion-associated protein EspG [Pseudonocardia sp. TRM90224]